MASSDHSPDRQSSEASSTQDSAVRSEVRDLLRSAGLRVTHQRLEVLVVLHNEAAPMTHEQIMARLPAGTGDKASVWRLLADLAKRDILRRMDLGDRVWRYELRDTCRKLPDDHSHLLCEACGAVSCLPELVVRAVDGSIPLALQGANFRVRIMGVCSTCTVA